MAEFVSDKKKIAKNTMFLYIRMVLVMLISLYISRVILQTLGASDFGVYNVVGGVVVLMSFINGPLHSATVRFLTYELGRQDIKKLSDTFAASLNLHLGAGLLAIILGETIGLWFFYNKLVIPEDRMTVAFWVYQFSIINCFFDFTQVPYTASINAHEKMSVYAYIGLYEAISKLTIVYLIAISPWDKLLLYAFLLMLNKIAIQFFCRYYTRTHYQECRFRLFWDKPLYSKLSSYAGWDTFGGVAYVCENQGINVLLNLFFGPVVNTARAIALQIQTAVSLFVNNLLSAIRPQVVKNYAVGNYKEMYHLTFSATRYTYFMLIILILPIIFEIDTILHLWLGKSVPEYTSIFSILVLLITLINTIDLTILMAFHAIGKIKFGNIFGGTVMIASLPIGYLCLEIGCEPQIVFVVVIIINIIETIFDLFLTRYYVPFSLKDFFKITIFPAAIVTAISLFAPVIITELFSPTVGRFLFNTCVTEFLLFVSIWLFGINSSEKKYLQKVIKTKLLK